MVVREGVGYKTDVFNKGSNRYVSANLLKFSTNLKQFARKLTHRRRCNNVLIHLYIAPRYFCNCLGFLIQFFNICYDLISYHFIILTVSYVCLRNSYRQIILVLWTHIMVCDNNEVHLHVSLVKLS